MASAARIPEAGAGDQDHSGGGRIDGSGPQHDGSGSGPRGGGPLPSLLTRELRLLLAAGLVFGALTLADTVYLVLVRVGDALGGVLDVSSRLPGVFQGALLAHTALGVAAVVVLAAFAAAHLRRVWRRRSRAVVASGAALLALLLLVGTTGGFILTEAASRAHRWAWWAHVAAGAALPVLYAIHRRSGRAPIVRDRLRLVGLAGGVAVLVLLGAHASAVFGGRGGGTVGDTSAGHAEGGAVSAERAPAGGKFRPPGRADPRSPFFPSPARTGDGEPLASTALLGGPGDGGGDAPDALPGTAGCVRCHPDVTRQWAASAHRFASFNNPFYEASVRGLREAPTRYPALEPHLRAFPERGDRPGRVRSQWCGGCHDPALLLTDRMLDTIRGDEPAAQAGLTCLACHGITQVDRTGNGGYTLPLPIEDPYLFADADPDSPAGRLHDLLLRARPEPHRRRMRPALLSGSEFCGVCHKVSLREPLNGYRWLRGQNEYDAWHDSGVSGNAARTFYLPPEARDCADCHMPPEQAPEGDMAAEGGSVSSHRFAAANTALPWLRADAEQLERVEAFLRDDRLSVDIFAVRREGDGPPRLASPDSGSPARLPAGSTATLGVVVRNRGVGHAFPGGTIDSNEAWLAVDVHDGSGRLLGRSGAIGPDGQLDPDAHRFKGVFVDEAGFPIQRRNAQDIRTAVYVRTIGPGSARLAHYRFTVPPGVDALRVRVRLLWRKFDRPFTEFVYRSVPERFDGTRPDLPVTEIARAEARLPVAPPTAAASGDPEEEEGRAHARWERWNDYGIALLAEGDTRDAWEAFRQVASLRPAAIDGPLNQARAALREGALERARERLREAEAREAGHPRVARAWALLLQEEGRYAAAERAWRRVLEAFPEDREAWKGLGRTRHLDGRPEEALEALDRALAIDPEDRTARWHRLLALRAAGREREAAVAAAAWEYFRPDESASRLARRLRLAEPGVNRLALPVAVHPLELGAP